MGEAIHSTRWEHHGSSIHWLACETSPQAVVIGRSHRLSKLCLSSSSPTVITPRQYFSTMACQLAAARRAHVWSSGIAQRRRLRLSPSHNVVRTAVTSNVRFIGIPLLVQLGAIVCSMSQSHFASYRVDLRSNYGLTSIGYTGASVVCTSKSFCRLRNIRIRNRAPSGDDLLLSSDISITNRL